MHDQPFFHDTVHDKIFLIPVNDTGQNPADLLCNVLCGNIFRNMFFDVFDCPADRFRPFLLTAAGTLRKNVPIKPSDKMIATYYHRTNSIHENSLYHS